jgi:hypothetical protein
MSCCERLRTDCYARQVMYTKRGGEERRSWVEVMRNRKRKRILGGRIRMSKKKKSSHAYMGLSVLFFVGPLLLLRCKLAGKSTLARGDVFHFVT